MGMRVNEVAALVGISVRTLHHYHKIELLKPEQVTITGYRIYSDENLEVLQQILFFKELGFPLKKIKSIINSPSFDRQEALTLQRKMLLESRERLDNMIITIEKTISEAKGEIEMTKQEKFAGFDFSHNPYEKEAREKWGDQAVDRSNDNLSKKSKSEQTALSKEMNDIYGKLAKLRDGSPTSIEAQVAIKDWYDFLNNNFSTYSLDAFKGLGQMYVDDVRFTKNIDKFGVGLAKFMCEAMAAFSDQS